MKANSTCRVCGIALDSENWSSSRQKGNRYICKNCNAKQLRLWRKANPEKARAQQTRANRKRGVRPFDENKECTVFLGVHVAERVLSRVFKNVERMPYGHSGYDFICNKGKKIDVKSACQKKQDMWEFHISHNTTADFFLCLAFDNREDLNPLHVWLLPGSMVNHLTTTAIRQSTIHKWDAHRLNISEISTCCDTMR